MVADWGWPFSDPSSLLLYYIKVKLGSRAAELGPDLYGRARYHSVFYFLSSRFPRMTPDCDLAIVGRAPLRLKKGHEVLVVGGVLEKQSRPETTYT